MRIARRTLRAMMMPVVVGAVLLGVSPPNAVADSSMLSRLDAGQRWMLDSIGYGSPSGRFELFLFTDGGMQLEEVLHLASSPPGSLAEFGAWDGVRQDINRDCQHGYLSMQTDGNLVMYCRRGDPIWSTHTAGTGRLNHFAIQNDGNLVVYTASGHAVWASRSTAPVLTTGHHLDPGHRLRTKEAGHAWVSLTMHRSGELVLTYGSRLAWRSGTRTPGSRLLLLRDGNLVIRSPRGHTLWSTHTRNAGPGASICVLDDGRIAEARLTTESGRTRWSRQG